MPSIHFWNKSLWETVIPSRFRAWFALHLGQFRDEDALSKCLRTSKPKRVFPLCTMICVGLPLQGSSLNPFVTQSALIGVIVLSQTWELASGATTSTSKDWVMNTLRTALGRRVWGYRWTKNWMWASNAYSQVQKTNLRCIKTSMAIRFGIQSFEWWMCSAWRLAQQSALACFSLVTYTTNQLNERR